MTTTADALSPSQFQALLIDYPKVWVDEATGRRHVRFAHCLLRNGHGLDLNETKLPHDRLSSLVNPSILIGAVSLAVLTFAGLVSLFFAGAGQVPEPWVSPARVAAGIGGAGLLFAAAVLTSPHLLLRPVVRRWEAQNLDWWGRNRTLIKDAFDIGGSRHREATDIVLDLNRITRSLSELPLAAGSTEPAATAMSDAVDAIWAYIDASSFPDNQAAEETAYRAAAAKASVAANRARDLASA